MLGDKTITTSVARPEIANDVVGEIGRGLRRNHGIGAYETGRQITSTRVGVRRDGRANFSNCWHRDLPCDLNLGTTYTDLFDDVATQMRWF